MKKVFKTLFRPYHWLEKWDTKKHLIPTGGIVSSLFFIAAVSNKIWKFPYFYLFFISFSLLLMCAVVVETKFAKKMNEVRALTLNEDGLGKANASLTRFELTSWTGAIALFVAAVFSIGGLYMFGAKPSLTLILCMVLFIVTVYLSIVGYVQYILLFVYIVRAGNDKNDYKHISNMVAGKLPAEVDWLHMLTSITHFYRAIFFTVGTFYILAFWLYCNAPDFLALSNHWVSFLLWGIITAAIVVVFPVISIIEYYYIKRIVKKVKTSYLLKIKKDLAKNAGQGKTTVERTILNQLFSTSILSSPDYPIRNLPGLVYTFLVAFLNLAGSVDSLMQLGDRIF